MGLKTKLVITVNAIVIVACTIMGVIGYLRAEESFIRAMQMKVGSDVNSFAEILNSRYEGNWHLQNGVLYKGERNMEADAELLDELSKNFDGQVTIFNGDNRAVTTMRDVSGKRQIGSKASPLNDNLLDEHYAGYLPIKDASGSVLGMLFVGFKVGDMNKTIEDMIFSMAVLVVVIVFFCIFFSSTIIGGQMKQITDIADNMKKIASGNLRTPDLRIVTRDEFGALAESVNDMKIRLKNLLTKISECSERIISAGRKLTDSTQRANDAITTVAASMEVLTNGTFEQEQTIIAL